MKSTLQRWQLWQEAQGLSTRTITERLGTIRHLAEHAKVDPVDIEPDHIIAFVARPGMSGATRATYHASIRAFSTWMQRTGLRADNVADQTPRPRRPKSRPRPVEASQLEALLHAANRKRTRSYVLLGALAGLRVHEIAKIHGRDIDPYTGILTVTGKGGKVAAIPLHDRLIEEARHYPRDAYWFPAYSKQTNHEHVNAHAVSAGIRQAMLRAGIQGKPHQLRHFYGTELVRAGVNLRIVQTLMRHESPATTAIYTDVNQEQQRAGIAALQWPAPARAA